MEGRKASRRADKSQKKKKEKKKIGKAGYTNISVISSKLSAMHSGTVKSGAADAAMGYSREQCVFVAMDAE